MKVTIVLGLVAMTACVVVNAGGLDEIMPGMLIASLLGNSNNRNCVQYGGMCQAGGQRCCQDYGRMICRNNMCLQATCQGPGQSCSNFGTNFNCCYHQGLTCNGGMFGNGVCVIRGGFGTGVGLDATATGQNPPPVQDATTSTP